MKKRKRRIRIIIILILIAVIGYFLYQNLGKKEEQEVKVISQVEKYGYSLKENKPKKYKEMFEELKKILNAKKIEEEEYAKKITEMFIYDFYSLNDKTAKTDVGGVEFIHPNILENFLENAQDTYYKYIENNIYNNRKQSLPTVSNITIEDVKQQEFAYEKEIDDKAYVIKVNWSYTDDSFSNYQREATLVLAHVDHKLYIIQLQ